MRKPFKRNVQVTTLFDESEIQLIVESNAKKLGLNNSEYIRFVLYQYDLILNNILDKK